MNTLNTYCFPISYYYSANGISPLTLPAYFDCFRTIAEVNSSDARPYLDEVEDFVINDKRRKNGYRNEPPTYQEYISHYSFACIPKTHFHKYCEGNEEDYERNQDFPEYLVVMASEANCYIADLRSKYERGELNSDDVTNLSRKYKELRNERKKWYDDWKQKVTKCNTQETLIESLREKCDETFYDIVREKYLGAYDTDAHVVSNVIFHIRFYYGGLDAFIQKHKTFAEQYADYVKACKKYCSLDRDTLEARAKYRYMERVCRPYRYLVELVGEGRRRPHGIEYLNRFGYTHSALYIDEDYGDFYHDDSFDKTIGKLRDGIIHTFAVESI